MSIPRTKTLAYAGAGIMLALAALIAWGIYAKASPPANQGGTTAATASSAKAAAKNSSSNAPRAHLASAQYGAGLYHIDMQEYDSRQLAGSFDFIAKGLEPQGELYPGEGDIGPMFPPAMKVADIHIPSKKLRLMVLYMQHPGDWCQSNRCFFQLYAQKSGGWDMLMAKMTTADGYLQVDDASISIFLCEEGQKTYKQWILPDGRLDQPLTINDNGYFKKVGTVSNPAFAACK